MTLANGLALNAQPTVAQALIEYGKIPAQRGACAAAWAIWPKKGSQLISLLWFPGDSQIGQQGDYLVPVDNDGCVIHLQLGWAQKAEL